MSPWVAIALLLVGQPTPRAELEASLFGGGAADAPGANTAAVSAGEDSQQGDARSTTDDGASEAGTRATASGDGSSDKGSTEVFTGAGASDAGGAAIALPDAGQDLPAPYEARRAALRLAERDDLLAIGGRLYQSFQYAAAEQADEVLVPPLLAPGLMDLYLDGRPTERLRAFASGRLTFDFTQHDGATDLLGGERRTVEAVLDQLWLKFDLGETLYVTVGRQPLRWGTGRFWNPSDFVNRQRRDPLALIDRRVGLDLVKLHLPLESLGWNLYAILDYGGAPALGEAGLAARAELLYGTVELALSAAGRRHAPTYLGADVSFALWWFDLRAEVSATHGDGRDFWRGGFDLDTLTLPEAYRRQGEWIPQAMLGLDLGVPYGDDDRFFVSIEYLYNDFGYADPALYPVLALSGTLTPLYLGRHYLGAALLVPAPGSLDDHTFTASALANLSDETQLVRLDYSVRLLTLLTLNAWVQGHLGRRGGELRFGYDVPPIPGTPLAQGLSLGAPLLEAAVALTLRF